MIKRKVITTKNAPQPEGPCSQAIVAQNMVFVSACFGIDENDELPEDLVKQTELALHNMHVILRASCSGYSQIAKITIMVKDIQSIESVYEVCERVFKSDCPALTVFEVANLHRGALVGIDCIAVAQNPPSGPVGGNSDKCNADCSGRQ